MTSSDLIFGWHKLIAAITYLDERSIDSIGRGEEMSVHVGDRLAISVMREFLPNGLDELLSADRASRWELPKEAREFLEGKLVDVDSHASLHP